MKDKVLNYIKKHNLIKQGDRVLCAVSGGADSVCMLDLLISLRKELSFSVFVAHLNHNLRGDEAVRDENFVKKLCDTYSVPFYSKSVDVNAFAKELKVSCEEAGRIARYDFFAELKKDIGITKIATAHNKNDNAETVLMRILRGTDLKGLSGIPVLNRDIIRPILCLSREEIEEYLECKGLDFVTDSTNLTNDFTRNKLRNSLIPTIVDDYNEGFLDTFTSNIEVFKEANSYIDSQVDKAFDRLAQKTSFGYAFSLDSLLKEDAYIVKRIIKKAVFNLTNCSITNLLCKNIFHAMNTKASISINKQLDFYVKYDTAFFVTKTDSKPFSYNINSYGTHYIPEFDSYITVEKSHDDASFSDKNTIYLDTDKVSCDFVIRSKKDGDAMYISNCGTKKLKNIMIDEKIPSFLRSEIPVLEYNNDIIWLCGVRDNVNYRATTKEKQIKITLHKEKIHE